MKTIGIILIVIGLFLVLLPGITFTKKKEVLDTGSIQINRKENKNITWPWYAGGIIMVIGVVMLISGNKKTK
jgi:uncharacterized membrane protein